MNKKRLVLIDGNAILHRAYHALPPLTNRSGQLVNAVYGFSTMLLKVINDLKPQYLAVAFDTEKPTFRKMEYLGYQAKRPEIQEELVGQIGKVREVIQAFDIPIYEIHGFEADDVIGTLARQASEDTKILRYKDIKGRKKEKSPNISISQYPNIEVIIVTGDRDLMQLVGPNIRVYAPVRGMSEAEMFNEEKVKEKLGVSPEQVVDLKGLTGDSSDNYPGVPGVGPKTASELLKKYKTLENLYQHLDQLPETLSRKLEEGRELAQLSQKLARIVTDAPVELDLGKCQFELSKEERKRVVEKFKELGFRSLVGRLGGEGNEKTKKLKNRKTKREKDLQQELFNH